MQTYQYVSFTIDDMNDGCGVFVDKYFITAAHVVAERPFKMQINNKTIIFPKEKALIFNYNESKNGADIAIFKVDGIYSPLKLDNIPPSIGMQLDSISYKHVIKEELKSNSLLKNNKIESYERLHCIATIDEVYGNFFQCKMSIILKEGSSGSPVFRNGKLFGILHGGQPGKPICVFQSSASIISMLKEYKI